MPSPGGSPVSANASSRSPATTASPTSTIPTWRAGRYLEQIRIWQSVFPPERMLIIRSEDFFADPETSYAKALSFLGLPAWRPRSFARYNAAAPARMEPSTRERLERYFADPNRELAEHLGFDLGWSS